MRLSITTVLKKAHSTFSGPWFRGSFRYCVIALSESARWSSLRTIGQSPTVRLTILVPFIGYVLLFNAQVQNILKLSIPIQLNYLYFGLLTLGLGSSLYAIIAPEQIKQHPVVADYIHYMDDIATDNLVRNSFYNILKMYISANRASEKSSLFNYNPPQFPETLGARLGSFINDIFENTRFDDNNTSDQTTEASADDAESHDESWNEFIAKFYTGSGYIDTDEIINVLWSNPKVVWGFTKPIVDTAIKQRRDIFYMEHSALNYSRIILRITVASLFFTGFVLLLIPTVKTALTLLLAFS